MQATDRPFSETQVGQVEMRVVMGGSVIDQLGMGAGPKAGRSVTVDITAAEVEAHGVNGALLRAINKARDELVAQTVQE